MLQDALGSQAGASGRQDMIQALQRAVRDYVDAHGDASGIAATPLRGVGMMRADEPTGIMTLICKPLVCLILQGAKQVMAGPETYTFAAGQSALVSADVPIVSRITRASRAEPYLALAVELDMAVLLDLSTQLGGSADAMMAVPAVLVDDTDAAVADCALRLMRLLDRADAIPVLHPAVTRELHYWLLAGRHGRAVRGLACPGGAAQRIDPPRLLWLSRTLILVANSARFRR